MVLLDVITCDVNQYVNNKKISSIIHTIQYNTTEKYIATEKYLIIINNTKNI